MSGANVSVKAGARGLLVAMLALTACGRPAPTPVATPTPTSAAVREVRAEAAQAAVGDAMPSAFLGRWGTASGCTGAVGRFDVSARRIVEDGAPLALADVEMNEPGVATVTLTAAPALRREMQLHVAEDGGRLDRIEEGRPDMTYFRCGGAR